MNSLIYQFENERELVQSIQELWELFNQKRTQIGEYPIDEKLVSAYTAFYLPTNFPKLEKSFEKLGPIAQELNYCDFYDIGSGPGTYSLAYLEYFKNFSENIFVVDSSLLMRKQALKLLEVFHPLREKIYVGPSVDSFKQITGKGSKKVFFFGHSFNEMAEEEFHLIIREHEPDYVLFLEPGTKEVFAKLLAARDFLLGESFEVNYPCYNSSHCPMKGTSDWCHQYLTLRHSVEVERLCQILKIDRRNAPVTLHLYSKKKNQIPEGGRVVATYPPSKHGIQYRLCEAQGSKLALSEVEVMYRNLTKVETKALEDIQNGDEIRYEVDKVLGSGARRIRVKKSE